jgi:recA bacterial DNA recombination protein
MVTSGASDACGTIYFPLGSRFTNQIREKIGVMFGNPETTPGGKALKFYSTVRIDIRRIAAIKQSDGTVIGNRTRAKVIKNKVAPAFTEADFDIMYNEGISNVGALLDLALEKNILEKRGSWISYKGQQLAQGRDVAKDALRADQALYEKTRVEQVDVGKSCVPQQRFVLLRGQDRQPFTDGRDRTFRVGGRDAGRHRKGGISGEPFRLLSTILWKAVMGDDERSTGS